MVERAGGQVRAMAAAAWLCWGVHAAECLWRGEPWDLLWMCNVGGALVALGWTARDARVLSVASCWLAVGTPLWALDLLGGGELRAASVLSHVGGLVLAGAGVRRLGFRPWSSVPATLGLAALVALSRLTPPSADVNLAHAVWPGWEGVFSSHGEYLAAMAGVAGLAFVIVDLVLSSSRVRHTSE